MLPYKCHHLLRITYRQQLGKNNNVYKFIFFLPAYFGPPLMKTWYLVSPFTKVMKKNPITYIVYLLKRENYKRFKKKFLLRHHNE